MAALSRFCVFWTRKTIRNVTMVVPVLMTSCQVSLKPNNGPKTAHATIVNTAMPKPSGCPATCDVHFAKREKGELRYTMVRPPQLSVGSWQLSVGSIKNHRPHRQTFIDFLPTDNCQLTTAYGRSKVLSSSLPTGVNSVSSASTNFLPSRLMIRLYAT